MADNFESLNIDVSKALKSLDKLDAKIDVTISKVDKLFTSAKAGEAMSKEEESLKKQLALRNQIIDKINAYQQSLANVATIDDERYQKINNELKQITTLGKLYAMVSSEARKIGEELGTSSEKFQRFSNVAASLKREIDAINGSIKNNTTSLLAKNTNDLANAETRLTAITQEGNAAKIQEAQVVREAIATRQLELTATNESLGAYSQLIAKYELARKKALDLASAEVVDKNALKAASLEAAALSNRIGMVANSVNQLGAKAEKGIPAVYSLQQVLLETPNAALGARTYVMSLSNNIPMLFNEIGTLAKTTKVGTTETLGLAGALKVLGSSISWVSLLMVAITTAAIYLTNNWDKLMKLFSDSTPIIKLMGNTLGKYNEQLLKTGGEAQSAYSDFLKLSAAIERHKKGIDDASKAQRNANGIIDLARKMYASYGVEIKGVNDAILAHNKYAQDYIKWALNMAVSQKTIDQTADLTLAKRGFEQRIALDKYGLAAITQIRKEMGDRNIAIEGYNSERLLALAKGDSESQLALTRQWADGYEEQAKRVQEQILPELEKDFAKARRNIHGVIDLNAPLSADAIRLKKQIKMFSNTGVVALALMQSDFDKAIGVNKESLKKSMDDLVGTEDKGNKESAKRLREFGAELLNFDYQKPLLEKMKGYYGTILADENTNYQDRLNALKLYTKASEQLLADDYNFKVAQAESAYKKESEQVTKTYADNKDKISKGAKDRIAIYNSMDKEIAKSITDFNTKTANLDEEGKLAALNTLKDELTKKQELLSTDYTNATSNDKAYISARIINLKNLLGKLTEMSQEYALSSASLINESFAKGIDIDLSNLAREAKDTADEIEQTSIEKKLGLIALRMAAIREEAAGYAKVDSVSLLIESLNKEYEDFNLTQDIAKDKLAATNKNLEKHKALLDEVYNAETKKSIAKKDGVSEATLSELENLNREYAKGTLTREEYEKASAEAVSKYNSKAAESAITYQQDRLQKTAEITRKIIDLEKDTSKQSQDITLADANFKLEMETRIRDKRREAIKEELEMAKKLYSQLISFASEYVGILNDNAQLEIDNAQAKADEEEKIKLAALEVDGLTAAEQEANTKKKDELEAWYNSQTEAREKKKKELARETAIAQNKLEIVQAGIELATTLADIRMKQSLYASELAAYRAKFGLGATAFPSSFAVFAPMYALATASSAMKIAALVSKKFAEGGRVDKDMLALVGDAYKTEYGVTKEGEVFATPDKPTVMSLQKDTVIYKDKATFLDRYINKNVNSSITRAKELSYKRELSSLISGIHQIEKNTRLSNNYKSKYYEYIR